MVEFLLPERVEIHACRGEKSPCFEYAVTELARLLGRLNTTSVTKPATGDCGFRRLAITRPGVAVPRVRALPTRLTADGFVADVTADAVVLTARNAKGVLNGVYELAERFGFLFLLPGEAGEWPPAAGPQALPAGRRVCQPRFPWRGTIWESLSTKDYSIEEWLRFYAKLRFNAVLHEVGDRRLAAELGLRLEAGGHGLAKLLPRELFKTRPELFRMSQPEDFGGQRQPDYNFCVTHPDARRIIQANYAKKLTEAKGLHAFDLYADDLPGGGWCLCPACRALSPSDQITLAARHLAEVIRRHNLPMRFPVTVYHDTMKPGETIAPPPEAFLLYAPRERCYGHALDDPRCRRNRFYLGCLKGWMKKMAHNDDAHTCEYYFDQILFRGLYPFLPRVIHRDLAAYHRAGIECLLALQVAGPAIAPEYNMLFYAKAHWDAKLTPAAFIRDLAVRLQPENPATWTRFLTRRAAVFANAMRTCEHPEDIYLDYRWLPETVHPFGREMAKVYAESATALAKAARTLVEAAKRRLPARTRTLLKREAGRARFEAAEFRVMTAQQDAMNALGAFLSRGDRRDCDRGIAALRRAARATLAAARLARQAGIPDGTWYYRNINGWLRGEFERKAAVYAGYI